MKTVELPIRWLLCLIIPLLAGCGKKSPSEGAILSELQLRVFSEPYLTIKDLEVTASAPSGDVAHPGYDGRFKGSVALTTKLYSQHDSVLGTAILREEENPKETTFYGVFHAILEREKWTIGFSDISLDKRFEGAPISAWAQRKTAIEGSPESAALYAERDRQAEVARVEREKQAAEARKRLLEFCKNLAGSWTTTAPVRMNDTYAKLKAGGFPMYSITFPDETTPKGNAKITIFDEAAIHEPVVVDAEYTVLEPGKVDVRELQKKVLGESWSSGDTWHFSMLNNTLTGVTVANARYEMSLEHIAMDKLETERILNLKKFRKALSATWRSEEPMKRGNGKFQEVNHTYLLYAVSFPESDENKGTAQVRISVENDPSDAIEVSARFFFFEPDEVILVESDKKNLGTWTTGDRWSLKLVNDRLHASAVGSSDRTNFVLERVPRLDTPNKRQEAFFQLRATLSGTWVSSDVLNRKEKSVKIKDSSIAYRFEFPDDSQLSGGLRVVAFLVDSPADSVSVAANLRIINDTDFSITETERKQLSPNWTTGDTWAVRVKNNVLHAKSKDGSSMELRKRSE